MQNAPTRTSTNCSKTSTERPRLRQSGVDAELLDVVAGFEAIGEGLSE